jgi:hypothetical protein
MFRARFLLFSFLVLGTLAMGCKSKTGGGLVPIIDNLPGTIVAEGLAPPSVLAIDSTSIYFTSQTAGVVVKVSLANAVSSTFSTVQTLAAGLDNPFDIALDDTNVYCCERVPLGRIIQIPKNGGAYQVAAVASATPSLLVSDAANLYWYDTDGSVTSNVVALSKAPFSTPAVIVSGVLATSLLPDGGSLLVFESPSFPFFFASSGATLARIDSTTSVSIIASGLDTAPSQLMADNQSFYWIKGSPGVDDNRTNVALLPRTGGFEVTLLPFDFDSGIGGGSTISSLGIDATSAYFLVTDLDFMGRVTGSIQRVLLVGGSPVVVTSFGFQGTSLVTDTNNVYWADPANGIIWRHYK